MKLIALLLLLLIIVVSARKETERIVGGSATTTTTYPYQVAIVSQTGDLYQIFCGGSILSQNYVLTAAHCFREITSTSNQDRDLTNIYAVSTTKISEIDVKKRYQVLQANVHPMYSFNVDPNSQIDICVLRVSTISFDSTTRPVVLARSQDTSLYLPGTTSYVSGFGYTNGENIGGKSPSDNLMQVSIPVVSLDTCNQALANSGLYVNFAIVCAGADGKDACQGDSGGPLTVIARSNVYMQIGVVVFGTVNTANPIQCGAAGNYGVYTDVSAYRSSFIEPITGPLYNLGDSGVAINNGTGSPSSSSFVTYSAGLFASVLIFALF